MRTVLFFPFFFFTVFAKGLSKFQRCFKNTFLPWKRFLFSKFSRDNCKRVSYQRQPVTVLTRIHHFWIPRVIRARYSSSVSSKAPCALWTDSAALCCCIFASLQQHSVAKMQCAFCSGFFKGHNVGPGEQGQGQRLSSWRGLRPSWP